MEYTDLSKYGLTYKAYKKELEMRGVLDADISDLPYQIANKFILNYCNFGVSLCLYEPFTKSPSFYAFLLVKNRSVLEDDNMQQHKSLYKLENNELWETLSNKKGIELKEFVAFNETVEQAFNKFLKYIYTHLEYTCLVKHKSIYYWFKIKENTYNIPSFIREKLKSFGLHITNMPYDANILIITAE